jgi:hypothetical protein
MGRYATRDASYVRTTTSADYQLAGVTCTIQDMFIRFRNRFRFDMAWYESGKDTTAQKNIPKSKACLQDFNLKPMQPI